MIAARHPKGLLADGAVCWRPWDERDLPLVEEASRDDYVALIEHLPVPFDPVAGHDWIRRQENHRVDQRGWSFAIVETEREEAVGGIGITFRHPPGVAEPGCWVIARKRNQGFAEHATTLLCRWALMSDTGIARVQATVEPWNAASQRVVRETRQRVAEWWNCDNAEVGEWFPRRSGGPAFAHPRVGSVCSIFASIDELRVVERSNPQNIANGRRIEVGGGGMAEWKKQIFAVNLIVGDFARSNTFYREVFGLVRLGVGCADAASALTVQP